MISDQEILQLKKDVEDLKFLVSRKTGLSSADIRGRIKSGSSIALASGDISASNMFSAGVVDQAAVGANAVGDSEFKDESVDVTVSAGQTVGTQTVTSGSILLSVYPKTNQDQFIKSAAVSGTTLTITLLSAATANNVFTAKLIKV